MGYIGEAKRQYQREWMAKRREDYFCDKTCAACGSTDDLELDHVDPDLKISHRIWSWSKARRDVELSKCQVLCFYCHVAKTSQGRQVVLVHGTYKFYKAGCRCDNCRTAYRDAMRLYRSTGRYVQDARSPHES